MRALAFLLILGGFSPSFGYKAGAVGFSGKAGMTCSPCHSGGTAPAVMLSGPSALMRGETGTFTFTITTAAKTTGMGAAATSGVPLIAGSGTQEAGDELVQAAPRVPSAGKATYQFTMTAPNVTGAITIWAAGLAANANNAQSGDAAASTMMTVAILSPPDLAAAPPGDLAAAPNDQGSPADLGTGGDQGHGGEADLGAPPSASTLPGCAFAAGAESPGALGLLMLLLLVVWRARRGAYTHLPRAKSL
jgi:MYXO-CTERM domain-containing protein